MEKTKIFFDILWKYIALHRLKEDLKFYYGDLIDIYLHQEIEDTQKELQVRIKELFR